MEPLATRAAWSARVAVAAPVQAVFPFAPPAVVAAAQRRRVRATVAHAYEHVPHYRETMDGLGLRPADFTSADDLAQLPCVTRDDLQRDPDRFVSRAQPVDRYVRMRTGGSSGRPVTVYHDAYALFRTAGYRERLRALAMRLAGRRLRARQLEVSPPLVTGRETRGEFRRRSLLSPALRIVRDELSLLEPPAVVVERIQQFKPDMFSAYGSYVEALFTHLRGRGPVDHLPKVVTYGADGVSESIRRMIMEEFGIPILSAYGAVEAFNIGFECERHVGHHLNEDLYPVRIVDPRGETVPDGRSGEVVVSNLVNRGTVLLNYRMGDVASRLGEPCACGRSLPLLSFLEGRLDDWIATASEERMHPQSVRTLFTNEADVWRYRVAQRAVHEFSVAAVAAPGANRDAVRERLARAFAERFGADTVIDVRFVEELPRTELGKVRAIVSDVGRTGAGVD